GTWGSARASVSTAVREAISFWIGSVTSHMFTRQRVGQPALTVERFRELVPESRDLTVTRHSLPRLRALNFVVEGLLGAGVASQHRFDPQAKALGEWLRSRCLDIPEALL
ncbi:AtuA-related protein, partial [Streptomyces sp. NPDC001500]